MSNAQDHATEMKPRGAAGTSAGAPSPPRPTPPRGVPRAYAYLLAIAVTVALQLVQHRFLMPLPMLWYHACSAVMNAALVLSITWLYLRWRAAAAATGEALAELRASEAARNDMMNMLVHDLKSPLAAAGMALHVVQRDTGSRPALDPQQDRLLEVAVRGQERVSAMIGDLLDIARAEDERLVIEVSPTDLAALVAETVQDAQLVAEQSGIGIEVSLPDRCILMADADRLRRVVENLVGNALKFTPPDGQVTIAVRETGSEAEVVVRDSGPGIPTHMLERIFDRFVQVGPAGSSERRSVGLGLAFCRLAIEAHGGRIWAANSAGGGAEFHFTVPTQPVAQAQ